MGRTSTPGLRKNVILNGGSQRRLDHIREQAEFSTDAEAIRASLRLFEQIMDYQLSGYRIDVVGPDGGRVHLPDLHERRALAPTGA